MAPIPADPTKRLTVGRFRTLAHFIVRRDAVLAPLLSLRGWRAGGATASSLSKRHALPRIQQ